MNYVENNGKKVAAVLCVASCFPVVATVYAMETEPGWHGDKYIKEDATVAKGWEEIEGKTYYFSEDDGSIEKETTQKAVVASVSSSISGDVQETVASVAKEAVVEEVQKVESTDAPAAEEVKPEVEAPVLPEENKEPEVNNTENNVIVPQEQAPTPEVEVPAQPEVETPVQPEVQEPVAPEVEAPVQPEVETPVAPEVQAPVVPEVEAPVEPQPQPEVQAPVNPYADLNARIAAAAQTLVGVTDGQWCTEVVQQALALAGVSDAYQLWPDQYVGTYGYYTDAPQAGNLIYYNNGGRGTDHIAIYIGNGLAVHGNYNGRTVIESVYVPGGAPQFIQVCR